MPERHLAARPVGGRAGGVDLGVCERVIARRGRLGRNDLAREEVAQRLELQHRLVLRVHCVARGDGRTALHGRRNVQVRQRGGGGVGRGPAGRAPTVPGAAWPVARTTGDIERESSNEGLSHRTGATARSHNDVELAVTLEESLTDEGSGRR